MSPKASNVYCWPMETDCDSARRAKPLLGTFVEITASGARKTDLNAGIDAAFDAVAKVHRLMSFHEPNSDVTRLNQFASQYPVSIDSWTYEVLRTAIDLNFRSRGAFDITVAPVLQGLGWLPGAVDKPWGAAQARNPDKDRSRGYRQGLRRRSRVGRLAWLRHCQRTGKRWRRPRRIRPGSSDGFRSKPG